MDKVKYNSFHHIAKTEKLDGKWEATTNVQGFPITAIKEDGIIKIFNRHDALLVDPKYDAVYRELVDLYMNITDDVVLHMVMTSNERLETPYMPPKDLDGIGVYVFHVTGVDINFVFDTIESSNFKYLKAVEYSPVNTREEIEDMYWVMAHKYKCGILVRHTVSKDDIVFYSRPLDKTTKLRIVALEDSKRLQNTCSGVIVEGVINGVAIRTTARLGISVFLGGDMYDHPDNYIGRDAYIQYKKVHNGGLIAGRFTGMVEESDERL